MIIKSEKKLWLILWVCSITIFLIGLLGGSEWIIVGKELSGIDKMILKDIRFPRVMSCFLVGGALGVAGASFQGILRNPLADPYILGVSSGAGLGAGLAICLGLGGSFIVTLGAMGGAVIAIVAVGSIVKITMIYHPTQFILAGIVVNAFLGALMMLVLYLSHNNLSQIMGWLMGDMGRFSTLSLIISGILVGLFVIIIKRYATELNCLALGDRTASSLGIDIKELRKKLFVLTSLLTGLAVSMAGMIGFVGLVVPHAIRCIYKDKFETLLPASFLAGGILLIGADCVSRSLINNIELPIGLITAVIGGPFFVILLKGNKNDHV